MSTKRKLLRLVRYNGQKVWKRGEWFAGVHYPGPRILTVMRQSDSPFPKFLNGQGEFVGSISGHVREALAEYNQNCREERDTKDFVLDGRIAVKHDDGYIDFPDKLPPKSSGAVLMYYIDDIYSYSVFKAGEGTQDYATRRKRLKRVIFGIDSKYIKINHNTKIDSRSTFNKFREDAAVYRQFGVVLRENAPYQAGKSGIALFVPPEG